MKQVHLVALVGIDYYEVMYICLSEKTAIEKFTDLKLDLIKKTQEDIERINGMTDRDVGYRQRRLEGKKEYIQELRDLEFPGDNGAVSSLYESPIVQVRELLE